MDHQQSFLSTTPGKVMLAAVLLIIIAFIGIKHFVGSYGLDDARSKAADARTMGVLSSYRAQAEVYWSTGKSYAGVCSDPDTQKLFTTSGRVSKITCYDNADGFAAIARLSTRDYYCVDSRGIAVKISTKLATGQTICPAY